MIPGYFDNVVNIIFHSAFLTNNAAASRAKFEFSTIYEKNSQKASEYAITYVNVYFLAYITFYYIINNLITIKNLKRNL